MKRQPRNQGRRVIAASEFKAHCLRLLEDVASGQEVLVTKRGQEVALVVPVRRKLAGSSRGSWKGMVNVTGDIVQVDWSADFDATR
ncbi:MAG: type II toxin-antitoxin system prevent-host-death family antitoxin [Myxococcaceae bacterium]|nr:type II toxin-antitoxin system prevent-host-death family antitoxin [Myxococcaceae bacterium]